MSIMRGYIALKGEPMKTIILFGALLIAFEIWWEVNKDRWM